MRALIATSVGVLSTATLLLQPVAASPAPGVGQASGTAHRSDAPTASGPRVPGSTRSLPLTPDHRAVGSTDRRGVPRSPHQGAGRAGSPNGTTGPSAGTFGLERHDVPPFSLVGVVWTDARQRLEGDVQIRTRSAADGRWSGWRTLTADGDHGPGPSAAAAPEGSARGTTAPLWVGPSDGVQVRVRTDGELPRGLRLELVDPGEATSTAGPGGTRGAHRAPAGADEPPAQLPELGRDATVDDAQNQGFDTFLANDANGNPHVGPRPGIVIREGWGADEGLREGGYAYGDDVKMAFVHHTAGSNSYSCKEAPKVIRGIYRYHVKSLGWRDIGYNFLIDKCGDIYEGRAGGVREPVRGAHTLGFNNGSMGVAVLGTFSKKSPPKKATDAIAKLTAWKLGLYGVNAAGSTRITSEGGKYRKGAKVEMRTLSGHRDGFSTDCPGDKLYRELGDIRGLAAHLQGR